MKKVEITKALEILKKLKEMDVEVTFDNMTLDKTIDLSIEALVMQYDKAD